MGYVMHGSVYTTMLDDLNQGIRVHANSRHADSVSFFQWGPPAWHAKAGCRGKPMEWWFPPAGPPHYYRSGLNICRNECPVRAECLEHAISHEPAETYGMWGGYAQADLKKMRIARRRANREAREQVA